MKLLNRSLKSYLLYSFILLMVTVPLFYFAVRGVLLRAVDKSLLAQLHAIGSNLNAQTSTTELAIWSKLDKDIHLEKTDHSFEDYFSTQYLITREGDGDPDPFRQIAACISVNGQFYKLVISTSMVENEDLLASIVFVEALVLIALMAGMLWINRNVSRKLWAPFYETLAKVQQYEFNRHSSLRLKDTQTKEFTDLNRTLEHLLNKNYSSYLAQKEFTENASHELQTPLAIFQSQLELLMQSAPLTAEQADLINALETNNKRLSRLNRSLILLTKIENDEYEPTEYISLITLVEKLSASYHYYFEKMGLHITENYTGDAQIQANKTLIEMLVSNLLSNAIKHNMPGGQLIIGIENSKLTVKNTGVLQPLDRDKIFQRFYKKGNEADGIGLGLSIVQRICLIGHYPIQYQYTEGMHAFSVDFYPTP